MSSSIPSRYSFYADPRYHDYHRSTQPNYYPSNDHNSNIDPSSQYPSLPSQTHRPPLPNGVESYNNSLPKPKLTAQNSDYAAINKVSKPAGRSISHQRFPSYDSTSAPFSVNTNSVRHDVILDYDDPKGAENSLYAKVRKAPSAGRSNPARV